MQSIEQLIAQEINAQPRQVAATVALLDEGATAAMGGGGAATPRAWLRLAARWGS